MELTLEDVKWGRKHNPYTQVGSGSYAPPEYVEDRTESTAAETVFSFMGKAVLAASMASQCWGVTQSITPAELLASTKGYRPIISGEAIQIIEQPQADVQVLPSIEEQIKTIVDWLNPGGMSGVATLLGVSRPTIYKWLEGAHGIKDDNQKRLMQLTEAVDYWRKQIAEPMPHGLIRRHLPSDTTLFDLLSEPELDLTTIHDAINLLARSQQRSLESIKNLESAITGGKASST
ncbi:MAG: hypothetical protein AB2745_00500 [Candidatus Thiodiazotropha endolucinida]